MHAAVSMHEIYIVIFVSHFRSCYSRIFTYQIFLVKYIVLILSKSNLNLLLIIKLHRLIDGSPE